MQRNPYSDLVKELKGVKVQDADFGRRLNELISINELLTTLNEAKTLQQRLDVILLTMLGQFGCLKGAVYIKNRDQWTLEISKGMRSCRIEASTLPVDDSWDDLPQVVSDYGDDPILKSFFEEGDFSLLLPARNEGKLMGLICLSRSMLGDAAGSKEQMLSIIADFGGVIISNSLYHDDLEEMNKLLQKQLFKLNTLYELTGAFARCYEDESVFQILSNNLMGQFFISRCAVLSFQEQARVIFCKGIKQEHTNIPNAHQCEPVGSWKRGVLSHQDVTCDVIQCYMNAQKLQYALPIMGEGKACHLLLLGNRLDRRELSTEDVDFILSLSEQAAAALENVRLQKEMMEKKRMEEELALAREIQQKLIPKCVPVLDGYELAAEMRPYYQVGGDFYDFIMLEDGRLVICLADVSGKSLPASMIMSTAQASLRALNSFSGLTPLQVIQMLNRHMYQSTATNKFITMFYAVLDPTTHTMHYINCGHNHPILASPSNTTSLLGLGGMVLGMFPKAPYKVGTVEFLPGTELLIYTDGLSEVVNGDGEEYGDDRLVNCLLEKRGKGTLEEEKNQIVAEVMNFSSNEMVDDMTLLMIRRN